MLTLDQVKSKSATRLKGLHPAVLAAATALIERSYTRGVPILITQGLRTIAEQEGLYAQGRTKPGKIVTNARGGYSYHNFGLSIDFALLLPNGSSVSWDTTRDGDSDKTTDWMEVVQEAKALGFEWGGDWTTFKDYPHFQMSFGLNTAQLRAGVKPTETQIAVVLAKIDRYLKEAEKVNKDVKVDVYVNGVKVGDGVLDAGVTYTPTRAVAEALGATVAWDKDKLRVDINKGAK
ncbi:M15 family metallopeptidase [Paenibacillus wynnii]|uniref:M15 family metallopeptidase n=1 Tax=Paenibacillus wynnii TaxID=268407 RepID=UPI00068A7B36|nr:M15 family metallopeptidase [Paenibacillus wynnii]